MENYKERSEQMLLEMAKQKETADKQLLSLEILIGVFSIIILLGFTFVAAFVPMADWLRIVLIAAGFVLAMIGIVYALKIEQTAGYYKCDACGHCYVPTFNSVLWAMHVGTTRHMRCPACGKKTWQKKVLTKD